MGREDVVVLGCRWEGVGKGVWWRIAEHFGEGGEWGKGGEWRIILMR